MTRRLKVSKLREGHHTVRGYWIITDTTGAYWLGPGLYTTHAVAVSEAHRLANAPRGFSL